MWVLLLEYDAILFTLKITKEGNDDRMIRSYKERSLFHGRAKLNTAYYSTRQQSIIYVDAKNIGHIAANRNTKFIFNITCKLMFPVMHFISNRPSIPLTATSPTKLNICKIRYFISVYA